jgi:hypothetical protein
MPAMMSMAYGMEIMQTEDRITVRDSEALTEPWEVVRTYRKAAYPDDELREFACAEGLRDSPER